MDFDIYCDESHPDLLISRYSTARYLVIGSVWLKSENRDKFKVELKQLKSDHKVGGEMKWTKASPSRQTFYEAVLTWFFESNDELRFRTIIVDKTQVNLMHYHKNDQELGFYKFYYQLLHHWISDFNSYSIFCDLKSNRSQNRLPVLKTCLERSNLSASVSNVQATRSSQSLLIQLADFLTGLVSSKYNRAFKEGSTKAQLIQNCEKALGKPLCRTNASEKKFNIFEINLEGGW